MRSRSWTRPSGKGDRLGLSLGGLLSSVLAANHPERVQAAIMAGTTAAIGNEHPYMRLEHFCTKRDSLEGWDKCNRAYWLADYPDFAEHFIRNIFSEPHSTKQIEDGIEWAAETNGEILVNTVEAARAADVRPQRGDVSQDRLPGSDDPRRRGSHPALCARASWWPR